MTDNPFVRPRDPAVVLVEILDELRSLRETLARDTSSTGPEKSSETQGKLMSGRDVMELLGVSRATYQRMRRADTFGPDEIRIGRKIYYRAAEVSAWIDAGCPPRKRWEPVWSRRRHAAR